MRHMEARCFCAYLWAIWRHRNNIVFLNYSPNPLEIMRMADDYIKEEEGRTKYHE